ncbi:MFS general substrate transporter [Phellopilus nigrolimitatus]|nr:MFS general substrate transporter [Phellopilus nigrolimitatus]
MANKINNFRGLDAKEDLQDVELEPTADQEATDKGVDRSYELKSQLSEPHVTRLSIDSAQLPLAYVFAVNDCLQHEIGFGRFQWELFILSGFGWMADNIWLQGVAVILPQIQEDLNPSRVEYVTLSLYVGLIIGATVWGSLADVIGRKLSWQITLFLAGTFGIAAGGAPNFVTLCALVACIGFGTGGNLPVDGALFLEHIPQSHQWLLTFLSAWWSVGQLIASLVVWVFITNYPADKGWRYSLYTMGAMTFAMFLCRYVIFDLQESSKYLVAAGRDEDAIRVLQYIANRNGKTITLTTEKLLSVSHGAASVRRASVWSTLKKSLNHFTLSHIRPLFSTRRLALNSSLIILIWGIIGLAYPLFNGFLPLYLQSRLETSSNSLDSTYRDYSIVSVLGIPGSIIACILVDWTRNPGKVAIGGRKMALALSTLLTGLFLFLFTTSKTDAAYLAFSCVTSLTQNAMYGVLYAYTPEVFPAPHRGTADALCSAFNRITGILAPVIKITTTSRDGSTSSVGPNVPVFVSAALFMVSAVLSMLLPIETAGKAAL